MGRGRPCYHGDGFLESLSFSASGFMDSQENASSTTTVPTPPLCSRCHVIAPGEEDDPGSLILARSHFGDSRISKNSCPAVNVPVFQINS